MLSESLEVNPAVLGNLVSKYAGTSEAAVPHDALFADLGLDSIAAVQLAQDLLAKFKLEVHSDELFGISLGTLTSYLQESNSAAVTVQGKSPSKSYSVTPQPVDGSLDLVQSGGVRTAHLLQVISGLSGIQIEEIGAAQTLRELGIDSSSSSKLCRHLAQCCQTRLKRNELNLTWTVQNLVDFLQHAEVNLRDGNPSNIVIRQDEAIANFVSEPQQQDGHPLNPFIALRRSESQFEIAARKSGFHGYWDNVAPLQDDLVLAYMVEAFRSLGVDLSEYPHGSEIPLVPHTPRYNWLMKRLLDILESRYIVIQRAGKVLRGSDRISVDHSSQLCQALRTQHPQFECEANLIGLIGPKLADCISGVSNPVSVLFGNAASLKVMEDFYANAPMMSASTDQLIAFLLAVLQSADRSCEHAVRILEVGAGTGGTTTRLAEALAVSGSAVEYVFTDVGMAFVTRAKARFGKRYPWMDFEVLNLEHEMPAAFQGQFDITLGANVVHATIDRIATCRRLRETLRPGGLMILSEVTRVIDWYDICFGLLDGWWLSEGGKEHPIQTSDTWMDTFDRAGFSSMGFSTGSTEEAKSQQLLVACNRQWDIPSFV